ncbi:MAG: DNA-protecting protein DprA [Brevinematales bacterium]|nr:DNA-protecting protein DprA [Brevinematales bacterium]
MSELAYYAALSSNDLIGPKRYAKIMDEFGGLKPFFDLPAGEQMGFLGIKSEDAPARFERMPESGEKVLADCAKKGIRIVTIADNEYPAPLKTIADPPYILYYYGEFNLSIPLVAVVGTREPSAEALNINRYFVSELVNYNIGIVSGMARGHDTAAHEAVIENNGYTIAVLACGVDIVYPTSNRELYRTLRESGTIVSEYPPGVRPDKWRFPLRNRIISGLANIVLIVQAPVNSGALITAKYAEAQGRDVYAVPGNPMDIRYGGTNQLIQRGAKVALSPEEIVLDLTGTKHPSVRRKVSEMPALEPDEMQVIDILVSETHIDEIAGMTKIPIGDLNALLTRLELKGIVLQYPGRFYIRNL